MSLYVMDLITLTGDTSHLNPMTILCETLAPSILARTSQTEVSQLTWTMGQPTVFLSVPKYSPAQTAQCSGVAR